MFPSTPKGPIPPTRSRTPKPSSHPTYPSVSPISSINTKRGIHSDVRLTPPLGRQMSAGGRWKVDTTGIQQPDRHPVMTTSGTEPAPAGPGPGTNHRGSFTPPRNSVQTSRVTSPTPGSIRSSLTAVHGFYDRFKPTAIIKRYEKTTKLEPPFIDGELDPLTTSFADG